MLLRSRFMEEISRNNSIHCLQVPVSDGIVLCLWESMRFCFSGDREVLGRAGFRSLNMGLMHLKLLCHPESVSGMFKRLQSRVNLPSFYTHLKSGCS